MRALLSPTALGTSDCGTSSVTRDRRTGLSKALIVPKTSDSAKRVGTVAWPVSTRTERVVARARNAVWVASIMRWWSTRSATTPAQAPSRRIGRNSAAVTRPRATPLPVRSRTTHTMATDCIQVPAWLTIWPPKKRRKLRLSKERKVSCAARRMRRVIEGWVGDGITSPN